MGGARKSYIPYRMHQQHYHTQAKPLTTTTVANTVAVATLKVKPKLKKTSTTNTQKYVHPSGLHMHGV